MKAIVFGASGSGTTTLARSLAEEMGWPHLDSDDYYWKKTDPPYQEPYSSVERQANIRHDFEAVPNLVLSGGVIGWNAHWMTAFDLAIFLRIPPHIRMHRLRQRELERYGQRWQTDPIIRETSAEFLEWAQQYDNPDFDDKDISLHLRWLEELSCPCLRLEGDLSNEERVRLAVEKITSSSFPFSS
ncbi:MAG: AAA family ATPase [Bacteroidota bacterium]